jgi:hypothetical protein
MENTQKGRKEKIGHITTRAAFYRIEKKWRRLLRWMKSEGF